MKTLFQITDTLPNKISYYHLVLFLASLPFDRVYSQVILISFALHTFIHIKKTDLKGFDTRPILLLVFAFILTGIGIIYTPNRSAAIQETDKQLAIFLFPVLLALSQFDLARYQKNLIHALAISCMLTILYLYYDAVKIILLTGLPVSALISESFINHNFSSPVKIHATYLSMYSAFSFIYFLKEFISAQSISQRIENSIPILILALGIIQLCSKSVIIALIISALAAPFFMLQGVKRFWALFYLTITCGLVVVAIFQIEPLRNHFFTELSKDLVNSQTPELTDSRVTRWDAALRVIERAPVFGYGSGSEAEVLGDEYFSRKLYHSYLNRLNAHNQYLSFMIKFGAIGLILYLLVLGYGFRKAIIQKNLYFFSFMLLITIISLSENILDVNKGIFFYSSLFSVFIFSRSVTSYQLPVTRLGGLDALTGNRELVTGNYVKHGLFK